MWRRRLFKWFSQRRREYAESAEDAGFEETSLRDVCVSARKRKEKLRFGKSAPQINLDKMNHIGYVADTGAGAKRLAHAAALRPVVAGRMIFGSFRRWHQY